MSNRMNIERVEGELAGVATRLEMLESRLAVNARLKLVPGNDNGVSREEFAVLVDAVHKLRDAVETTCGLYEKLIDDLAELEDA